MHPLAPPPPRTIEYLHEVHKLLDALSHAPIEQRPAIM